MGQKVRLSGPKTVVNVPSVGPLTPEGARLAEARAELAAATQAARDATVHAIRDGMTEAEAARQLGVTRMTVRAWLGKGK